jgi:hypothetical protein
MTAREEKMKLEEIIAAISKLTPAERSYVRVYLDSLADADWEAWDRQLEEDERAGKLDKLAEEILADHAAGKTTPL